MITLLPYLLFHYVACTLFFILVQRPLFYAYNRASNKSVLLPSDVRDIYRYGVKTDLKAASYMTGFPLIVVYVCCNIPLCDPFLPLVICDVLLSLTIGLVVVADTALYKFWQYKIDASVFVYLRSLKGAFASVSIGYIVVALSAVLLMSAILFGMMLIPLCCFGHAGYEGMVSVPMRIVFFLVFLLSAVDLFLIIRGTNHRPDSPGHAYYGANQFYNHCALNPLYNLIYSLSVKDSFDKQFHEFDNDYCSCEIKKLFPTKGQTQVRLLKTDRPNILFVVWESLSAHFAESLGGVNNVVVNVDRLSNEGITFTQCHAGSFRTDRGLVCLLSGYLGQPTTSIIRYTRKLKNLPALPRLLKETAGYNTMALHGGDMNILHKTEYYWASGHDELISQKDLSSDAPKCSWGIHDGYMFDWLYDDIMKKTERGERWYTTFQTLSSHEPFRVPYDRIKDDKIANAFAYTDDCFGRFVERLRHSKAWDNLLIVCTGDHCVNCVPDEYRKPTGSPLSERTHIPLLLLGGAVTGHKVIDTLMNQTDIAATLLGQMGLPHDDFPFSRDVLATSYTYPFAFHAYNNGFIYRDETGATDYDNVSKQALFGRDDVREHKGKIILQALYSDLAER